MRKQRSLVGFACFVALGCQRAESVAPTDLEKAQRSTATVPEKGPLAASAPPTATIPRSRCIVPMPTEPPPQAKAAESCPRSPDIAVPLTHGHVTFVETPQKLGIDVELAENSTDQQRGLMYSTTLGKDAGMLFSWTDERVRTFWMHNTCLSLDMLFIAKDGVIAGILEQVPVLNDEPRSIDCPAAYVLEVNAGYCRKHGIAPGQRVQLTNN